MTVFDKLRNCITEPRCRDCEGIPGVCEYDHQSVTIPKVLALDVLELLKEQEQKISVLQKAVEQAQKSDKLLDVFGKNYAKIVRCKDCMYWSKDHDHQCMIKQGWFPVKPDWFCADGYHDGDSGEAGSE